MAELRIKIPELLEDDAGKIEKEVNELISLEEKRRLLSIFIDDVMKGSKQLSDDELIKLGRDSKKGRFEKLKQEGLV